MLRLYAHVHSAELQQLRPAAGSGRPPSCCAARARMAHFTPPVFQSSLKRVAGIRPCKQPSSSLRILGNRECVAIPNCESITGICTPSGPGLVPLSWALVLKHQQWDTSGQDSTLSIAGVLGSTPSFVASGLGFLIRRIMAMSEGMHDTVYLRHHRHCQRHQQPRICAACCRWAASHPSTSSPSAKGKLKP